MEAMLTLFPPPSTVKKWDDQLTLDYISLESLKLCETKINTVGVKLYKEGQKAISLV